VRRVGYATQPSGQYTHKQLGFTILLLACISAHLHLIVFITPLN